MDDTHTTEPAARRWRPTSRLGLAAGDRQALYARTMANLESVCRSEKAPELAEFCSEQAEVALRLPECDDACRTLVHRFHHEPAR